VRKVAERLEIGTSVVRRILQELTKELENYRFLLIEQYKQLHQPYFKELTGIEVKEAIRFLKAKMLWSTSPIIKLLRFKIGDVLYF
jgi:hypothetical protein